MSPASIDAGFQQQDDHSTMATHENVARLLTCIDAKLLQLVNGLEVLKLFSFRVLLFPIVHMPLEPCRQFKSSLG